MNGDFRSTFSALTGFEPMPWQTRLYTEHFFKDDLPPVIDISTGLGKTMVMAIWLIARGQLGKQIPTRLIYVVDRRTVVDQATDLAQSLVQRPITKWMHDKFKGEPPAISTLRGQLADNREWSADPSRPAIIIGTVDLIGSALLFSGYRSSYKRRPLEAGLLGQDSLLVLDEAHLSKPFERLIGAINSDGRFQKSLDGNAQGKPMRVIRMSATSDSSVDSTAFTLQFHANGNLRGEDAKDPVIRQRFGAKKRLIVEVSTNVVDSIANAASTIAAQHPGSRIVIFVTSPKDVDAIRKALIKKDKSRETKIAQLTGTMRGLERDELVTPPSHEDQYERRVMQRFLNPDNDPSQGECFLISTSAGEVGFDLNADHLVGDAAPIDSWIQRLGRVNRRGNGDATVILIKEKEPTDKTEFDKACIATSKLFTDGMDVSPKALAAFKNSLTPMQIDVASSPKPTMVELTDILLDAWSMTSIIQPMPGRPEVGPWLRGIADELPQTTIAWRAELDELGFAELDAETVEEWFDTHRILTHETLSVPTGEAAKRLLERWGTLAADIREKVADMSCVIHRAGLRTLKMKDLIKELSRKPKADTNSIRNAELILPASFGGIRRHDGMLNGDYPKFPTRSAFDSDEAFHKAFNEARKEPDVADEKRNANWLRRRETQKIGDEAEEPKPLTGEPISQSVRKTHARFVIELPADDEIQYRLKSYAPKRERLDWGNNRQLLAKHVGLVRKAIDNMLARLGCPNAIVCAARLAADWHDHGKNRERWQRCAGQKEDEAPLGKSDGRMKRDPRGYRHEFGSLREFTDAFDAGKLLDQAGNPISRDVFDLAMHLIATHHGRGRPHFLKGGFDPDCEMRSDEIHTESIRRFARLQSKYGWWQLAWLENLLRFADAIASAQVNDDENQDDEPEAGE